MLIIKNWFKYTGFVQNLDNIRNQDWTHFDEVYDTHYQVLCHSLDTHMSLAYQEQMSCYVDGVFRDKIDQSISAKQSEQLVIKCALCGSFVRLNEINMFKPIGDMTRFSGRTYVNQSVSVINNFFSRLNGKMLHFYILKGLY